MQVFEVALLPCGKVWHKCWSKMCVSFTQRQPNVQLKQHLSNMKSFISISVLLGQSVHCARRLPKRFFTVACNAVSNNLPFLLARVGIFVKICRWPTGMASQSTFGEVRLPLWWSWLSIVNMSQYPQFPIARFGRPSTAVGGHMFLCRQQTHLQKFDWK